MGLKKLIDLDLLDRFLGKVKELIPSTYADSAVAGGAASKTEAIPFGIVDNTSTSTIFTATVPGITELKDGTAVLLKNGVVTSKAGFTININNLGAYPAYSNMAAATAESTVFNIDYTMLFVFDSTRGENGGWICYRGYDSNTNTIGYYIRTNSSSRPMDSITYRYRILFSSADDTKWVPSTNSTSTNATAARDVCQTPINPFGEIVYYGTTASVAAGSSPSTSYLWQQNVLTFGYAFNRTGAALVLTYPAPIYIKCAPQSDGSAVIDANTPYVQQLPSTADGKIYIYLGRAYSATSIELVPYHPVYYYSDGAIRLWTNQNGSGGSAESFIVNVTQDPNTEEYQADKTYTEIRSAIDNGLTVFARLNLSFTSVWYALLEDSSYGITFYLISVTDAWGGKDLYCERLTVSTENEWSMDSDNVTIIGESMEAESGGTDLSLVTTDEKYVWNSKYDASNPPPYPVTSVNGSTGAVTIPTLPSVSSSDNDKVLKVVSGAWAAATGDSGKVMVVNITFDSDSSEYSADKTFSEISTATNDGYVIVAKYQSSYLPLAFITNRYAHFERAVNSFSSGQASIGINGFYIYNDNTIYDDMNMVEVPAVTTKFISVQDYQSGYEVIDTDATFNDIFEIWNGSVLTERTVVLNYIKSIRDMYSDPVVEGEVEEYHLSNAYTVTEYDNELGGQVTTYHAQFVNFVDTSNGTICKAFGLVGFNSESIIDADVTYSEHALGGSGGAGNTMVVTIEPDGTGEGWVADKTFSEITTALEAGYIVEAEYGGQRFQCIDWNEYGVNFNRADTATGEYNGVSYGSIGGEHWLINSDNTIVYNISWYDIPSHTSELVNDSGFITGMTILSYGNSTWQDFLAAYNANKVVYCRASSNSNPASGAQTRMAFMAYIGGTTDTPTSVEFQYYRSVSSHTDAQQGDQVYVYKLTSGGVWSVTVRESYTKIVAGTNLSSSYSNGVLTINNSQTVPTKTSDLTNDSGFITSETDPTVPAWAKASTKPTYTASEVGALPSDTVIPSKTSDLTNDSGFLTSFTETDPTVPAWAKASSKPSYTASEVGALPDTTTIPSKTSDLINDSGFITGYTETDPTVPAWAKAASKPTYTASEVGALPSTTVIPSKTSDLTNDSGFITSSDSITGDAGTVNGYTVETSVPSNAVFTDTTYGTVSKQAAGLAPQLPNETTTTKFLRQDGSWAEPSDPIAYNDLVLIQDTQPTSTDNKIWIKETNDGVIIPTMGDIVRQNLLDNWYFVGGGSQNGYGTFPVNQRGQSSYSGGSEYCVDRWVRRNDNGTVTGTATISNDGLCLSLASGKSNGLNQTIEHAALLNKTVTISALFSGVSTGSLLKLELAAANESRYNSSEIGGVSVDGNGLFSATFNMPSSIENYSMVNFGLYCGIDNQFDGTLIAAKLEIGATQTLAHQENGVWVLNEIPNYTNELAKCQRYYIRFEKYSTSGWITSSAKSYQMHINLPVTMASTPTPTMTKYLARTASGYSAYTTSSGVAPTALTVPQFHGSNFIVADEIETAIETNNISLTFYIYDLALSCEP